MGSWQKRARLGVATFAVGFGAVVYLAIGERQIAAPPDPIHRVDPTASSEILGAVLRQVTGSSEDFKVFGEVQLGYDDGSVRIKPARLELRSNGRDFVITAKEAKVAPGEEMFELVGGVALKASDGFELATENATYDKTAGRAQAPGPVTFSKGRMTGSGVGMTYDLPKDTLAITNDTHVTVTDASGAATMVFEAAASTLQRMESILTLQGGVHVLRGEQTIDGDNAVALLSEKQEFVTFVELRGNARVAGGGGSLESMNANDIDLDYTDDGQALERVLMTKSAGVAVIGPDGTGRREIFGERLELSVAPDGTVTKATGQDGVRLALPADDDTPARSITARTLGGDGVEGKGLTSMRFDEMVEFREFTRTVVSREAHSDALRITLDDDRVADASFMGRVTFDEQGLTARGAEADYSPMKGTLHLSGTDGGGGPRVSDEQITIDAASIDLAFEGRKMTAEGRVRTTLRSARQKPGTRRTRDERDSRMPGLLKQEEPVTINADALDYGGTGGRVVYTGGAILSQGADTVIRGHVITIDQETGNLSAAGTARSWLVVDGESSEGTADEIRYDDAKRLIAYSKTAPGVARVKGSQGDLRAGRIDITLEPQGSRVKTLQASTTVSIDLAARSMTGSHLEYEPAEERYTMRGGPGKPVSVNDRTPGACRQLSGMRVVFYKSTENIFIDGEEKVRTKAGSGGPCTQPPLAPPR